MEIGITWENKLVYNKEVKISKKVIKTGAVVAGILSMALLVSLVPGTSAYALDATNKNGQLIKDTVMNTAQAKDIKYVWEFLSSNHNNIIDNGPLTYLKNTVPNLYDVATDLDAKNLNIIFDSLVERYATYAQGEVDIIKTLRDCMFN